MVQKRKIIGLLMLNSIITSGIINTCPTHLGRQLNKKTEPFFAPQLATIKNQKGIQPPLTVNQNKTVSKTEKKSTARLARMKGK